MNAPSGLVGKALAQIVEDMGSSPIWFQFSSVKSYRCWERKYIFLVIITPGRPNTSSLLVLMDSLFFWGNRPFTALLNNYMAGLGNPVPMGIDHISNEARFTSSLVSRHSWLCSLHILCMLPSGHCSVGVMMMLWSALSAKLSECIWCEVHTCIWNNFLGKSKFCEYNLGCFK